MPHADAAKLVIRLINAVSRTIAADPDMKDVFSVIFIPDCESWRAISALCLPVRGADSVSLAELICPAADISQHISTAGTEASGTSCMKFCLNGGLLLGTVDGANVEIGEEVGEDNGAPGSSQWASARAG